MHREVSGAFRATFSKFESHEISCCCSRNNDRLPLCHPLPLCSTTFSFSFSIFVVIVIKCLLSPSLSHS
ncbi:hypothetical protein WN55_03557 [Dufourea novaeangliae]|uniref:Uncharacterized protein n=1 Tax=Dufourea novaeangliae TaxID=178035 RepID=A0A154PIS3_DUFNO|nr:hypothetical protein WN55_03557 [Dufourea novaeangliae]